MLFKLHSFFGYLTALSCGLLGLTFVLSILNQPSAYIINSLLGIPLILFSLVLYKKARQMPLFKLDKQHNTFLICDMLIHVMMSIFFLLLLAMAVYRSVVEHYAVFD